MSRLVCAVAKLKKRVLVSEATSSNASAYALQGNAPAQYNLGRMYQWGKGVEKDLQQARFWFQKAIDNGHEKAKEALTKIKSDLSEKDTEDSFLFP